MSTTIYTNYRNIWSSQYGPIPKDTDGRSYEIHHIDGDHSNNHIDNLACLSIAEHYQVHYDQGDYGAAYIISRRMSLSPEEVSAIASKAGKICATKLLAEGRHNFQTLDRSSYNYYYQTEEGKVVRKALNDKMIAEGTNSFYDPEACSQRTKKRIKEGTHNLVGGVTVRDRDGTVVQIPKADYDNRTDDRYAHINSTVGRERKALLLGDSVV